MALDLNKHKETVRLNGQRAEQVRSHIQADKLMRLLQEDAEGVKTLSDGSRDSAKFLLNKALANPPQITMGAGDEGQHVIEVSWRSE